MVTGSCTFVRTKFMWCWIWMWSEHFTPPPPTNISILFKIDRLYFALRTYKKRWAWWSVSLRRVVDNSAHFRFTSNAAASSEDLACNKQCWAWKYAPTSRWPWQIKCYSCLSNSPRDGHCLPIVSIPAPLLLAVPVVSCHSLSRRSAVSKVKLFDECATAEQCR